jgi:hypothetical protein
MYVYCVSTNARKRKVSVAHSKSNIYADKSKRIENMNWFLFVSLAPFVSRLFLVDQRLRKCEACPLGKGETIP